MTTVQDKQQTDIVMCGVSWHVSWHEGSVTFNRTNGVWGEGLRVTVQKYEQHGLLYVQAESNMHEGFVPACYVEKATRYAETILGPNHFPSLDAEKAWFRSRPLVSLNWLGWRNCLVQIRGRTVFGWGIWWGWWSVPRWTEEVQIHLDEGKPITDTTPLRD